MVNFQGYRVLDMIREGQVPVSEKEDAVRWVLCVNETFGPSLRMLTLGMKVRRVHRLTIFSTHPRHFFSPKA